MQTKKINSCVLKNFIVSLRPLKYDGESNGYAVRVTQRNGSVKYIYRFPSDRIDVINGILNRIKVNDDSDS